MKYSLKLLISILILDGSFPCCWRIFLCKIVHLKIFVSIVSVTLYIYLAKLQNIFEMSQKRIMFLQKQSLKYLNLHLKTSYKFEKWIFVWKCLFYRILNISIISLEIKYLSWYSSKKLKVLNLFLNSTSLADRIHLKLAECANGEFFLKMIVTWNSWKHWFQLFSRTVYFLRT